MPEEWLRETGSEPGAAANGQSSDAPPMAYTWDGPVSATPDAGHWAHLHPAVSLGLFIEWIYFTVKVRQEEEQGEQRGWFSWQPANLQQPSPSAPHPPAPA